MSVSVVIKEVNIDGVSFNVWVVKAMGEKKFVEHPMHDHHYTHLKSEAKKEFLKRVYWEIRKIK